jgi:hypothetical protein
LGSQFPCTTITKGARRILSTAEATPSAKRPTLKDSQTDEENQRELRMAGRAGSTTAFASTRTPFRETVTAAGRAASTDPLFVRLGKAAAPEGIGGEGGIRTR